MDALATDRERIVRLFQSPDAVYNHRDAAMLLGIDAAELETAITEGLIGLEADERGTRLISWDDVATLALEEWTPRMIQAALDRDAADVIPYRNQHRIIQASLPRYQIRLLDHLARAASAEHRIPRNASDILERILHEYANGLDIPALEVDLPGLAEALRYPFFITQGSSIRRRCRYCDTPTFGAAREVCRPCEKRHEPEEYKGEYGLPALDESYEPAPQTDMPVDAVPIVTMEHGRKYADRWREEPQEAFVVTKLMPWPDEQEAQLHFHDIEDEIEERMWPEVREAMAAAFVKAATDVLAREHSVESDEDVRDE